MPRARLHAVEGPLTQAAPLNKHCLRSPERLHGYQNYLLSVTLQMNYDTLQKTRKISKEYTRRDRMAT